jgi:V/A-type H+-transporting ATPase subunit D
MRVKGELSFAREGHELLEQKREILILELKRFTARAIEAQHKVDEELAAAFAALKEAQLATGVSGVASAGRAVNIQPEVTVRQHKVMGVPLPAVAIELNDNPPYYGPSGTSVWTDEAVRRFKEALAAIATLAETRISVVRLAREIQKTIRRVNALERILLPDYEETLGHVEGALEEAERESFFILKLIKDRLEAQGR